MNEEMTVRSGTKQLSTLVNAVEAGLAFVYAQRVKESKDDARFERRKWNEARLAVQVYLKSSAAQNHLDPLKLASLLEAEGTAENRRERAQLQAMDATQKLGLVVAASAAGRTLVEMSDGGLGYVEGNVITPIMVGVGAFMLADILDDNGDDDGGRRSRGGSNGYY